MTRACVGHRVACSRRTYNPTRIVISEASLFPWVPITRLGEETAKCNVNVWGIFSL